MFPSYSPFSPTLIIMANMYENTVIYTTSLTMVNISDVIPLPNPRKRYVETIPIGNVRNVNAKYFRNITN